MCVSYLTNTFPFSYHTKNGNLKEIDRHLLFLVFIKQGTGIKK